MKRIMDFGSWIVAVVVAAVVIVAPLDAQAKKKMPLDRSVAPTAGKAVPLKVPAWTKSKLANGAELIVSQKRDLPLVSVTVNFVGGTNQFESPDKIGLGT